MGSLPSADFFKPAFLRDWEVGQEVSRAARKPVVHLSHGQCLDGAGSDVLVRLKFGSDKVGTIFCDPGEVLDRLKHVARIAAASNERKRFLVSDLSLQMGESHDVATQLLKLKDAGWTVEWRDHHHKQWGGGALEEIEEVADRVNLNADGGECGTSLVARDLLPGDDFAQEFAAIVRDIDLWIRKDPRSRTLTHARHEMGSEAFVEKVVRDKRFLDAQVEAAAAAWEKRFEDRMRRALAEVRVVAGRNKVGVIYGDYPGSDVCDRIRQEKKTDLEVNLKPDGKFSIRSASHVPVAASIAQRFGGGGHPNAAGGHLRMGPFAWTVYWSTKGDSVAARRLVEAARDAVPEKSG